MCEVLGAQYYRCQAAVAKRDSCCFFFGESVNCLHYI